MFCVVVWLVIRYGEEGKRRDGIFLVELKDILFWVFVCGGFGGGVVFGGC